jgi:uncharacterized membrane protein YoaK (UPF0700 family)
MGKTADNEAIKLRATYYNNLSVGLAVAGGLIPYFAFIQRAGEFLNWLTLWLSGRATVDSVEMWKAILATLTMALAFAIAKHLRGSARTEIAKIED